MPCCRSWDDSTMQTKPSPRSLQAYQVSGNKLLEGLEEFQKAPLNHELWMIPSRCDIYQRQAWYILLAFQQLCVRIQGCCSVDKLAWHFSQDKLSRLYRVLLDVQPLSCMWQMLMRGGLCLPTAWRQTYPISQ